MLATDALTRPHLHTVPRQVVQQGADDVVVVSRPRQGGMHQVDAENAQRLRLRRRAVSTQRELLLSLSYTHKC